MDVWVDLALVRRLEATDANSAAEYVQARLASDPQFPGAIREVAGGMAVRSGQDSPISFAVGIGLGTPVSAEDIQEIEEFFRRASIRPLFKLSPWADPGLWDILKQKGYGVGGFLNVWVLSLSDWIPPETPDDSLAIREVD
jgi:hypothetical protein